MKTGVHQYEDKLLELVYGELPTAEADAVEAHARLCARCSAELAQLRSVRATMRRLPEVPVPDAGLESLLAIAEQQAARNAKAIPQPWWRRVFSPRLTAALASASALVVVGVLAYRTSSDLGTPEEMVLRSQANAKTVAPAPAAAEPSSAPLAKQEDKAIGAKDGLKEAPAARLAEGPPAEEQAAGERTPAEGAREDVAWAPKGSLAASKGEGGKLSVSKRSRQANEPVVQQTITKTGKPSAGAIGKLDKLASKEVDDLDSSSFQGTADQRKAKAEPAPDYSNAAQRGGRSQQEAEQPQQVQAQATPVASPPSAPPQAGYYGLGTGTGADTQRRQVDRASNKDLEAKPTSLPAAQPVAPSTAAAPPAVASLEAKRSPEVNAGPRDEAPAPKGAPSKSPPSKSLPFEATKYKASKKGDLKVVAGDESDSSPAAELAQARIASKNADAAGQVDHALSALGSGVTGSQRAEALSLLCEGYEALGQIERADPYCDALLSEFPKTRAAMQLAQRRNLSQKAPAPSRPAKPSRSLDDTAEKLSK